MKWCFSTLGCYEDDLDTIIALARKYNMNGLEIRGIDGVMDNENIECFKIKNQKETLSKMQKNNLEFVILGTSCKFHDEDTTNKHLIKSRKEIDIAERFGFKGIRIFGNNIISDKSYEYLIDSINEICIYNRNIDILLETHGDFNTVETLKPIVDGVSYNPNFGIIWDIYHTYRAYGNNFDELYDMFKPYIKHIHIKDALNDRPVLFNKGTVDYKKVIKKLKDDQYDNYISIEWEKKWYDGLEDLEEVLISLDKDNL